MGRRLTLINTATWETETLHRTRATELDWSGNWLISLTDEYYEFLNINTRQDMRIPVSELEMQIVGDYAILHDESIFHVIDLTTGETAARRTVPPLVEKIGWNGSALLFENNDDIWGWSAGTLSTGISIGDAVLERVGTARGYDDQPFTVYSPDGNFHVRSTYQYACGDGPTWSGCEYYEGELNIIDSSSDNVRYTLEFPADGVVAVAWHPTGAFVALGMDGSYPSLESSRIVLVDPATGRTLFTLRGHVRQIRTLAFSEDGSQLASYSYDGTIIIWDVEGLR